MKVESLVNIIGADFYTGVPDSQLKALCNYLMENVGISSSHLIAANEGNCTALAAGYYLATGKIPVVYMQNSGIGNVINPVASLLNEKVYGIPCVFIIGWRGEPGSHDEPQHIYQGEVTIRMLEDMGISTFIIKNNTTEIELKEKIQKLKPILDSGKCIAFVISQNALAYDEVIQYKNDNKVSRENAIQHILEITDEEPVIATTGKASRELFEIRTKNGQSHCYDFLTVGSMGHSSSIALGIALNKPKTKVWCIDGDGAVLMHMGAMAVLGSNNPKNLVHIVLNNGAHETVGGMPTVAEDIDFVQIALGCGYPKAVSVNSYEELDHELLCAKNRNQLTFIEVKCSMGSRSDLGRPTTTAKENKESFMQYLKNLE